MGTYDTTTIKGRLSEYVRKHEQAGVRDFERRMGFSEGLISRPGGFSMDNLVKLAQKCPSLDLRWLLTGTGSMIVEEGLRMNNSGSAGQMAGNINNYSEVNNNTTETVCEEIIALKGIISDLRAERSTILKDNSRLITIIEKLTAR